MMQTKADWLNEGDIIVARCKKTHYEPHTTKWRVTKTIVRSGYSPITGKFFELQFMHIAQVDGRLFEHFVPPDGFEKFKGRLPILEKRKDD